MKPIENYEQINEAGEFKSLPKGIYVLKITDVKDVPEKEYLEVYSDIFEGEYKGYYEALKASVGIDRSKSCRSYKESALPFFKRFITAVEKSNPGYAWNWDEKTLIGKFVVGVFGEEEYVNKDNQIATIVRLQEFRSGPAMRAGEIKIPELKRLSDEERAKTATQAAEAPKAEVKDDDLPF